MKNIIFGLVFFSALFLVVPARATSSFNGEIRNTIRETVEKRREDNISPQEIRKEVRENVREQVRENREKIFDRVKTFLKKNLRFDVRKTCATATKGTNTLTINCDESSYTVNINEATKFIRKFGGKSSFDELAVGDEINVFGKFTDDSKTTINARLIRNLSIQKRWGVFFGEVTSVPDGEKFVMKTIQRGDMAIYFDSETKLLNHKKETITPSEIVIGMRVRVKGVWDKTSSEVRETEEVRVFPSKPTETPTSSP